MLSVHFRRVSLHRLEKGLRIKVKSLANDFRVIVMRPKTKGIGHSGNIVQQFKRLQHVVEDADCQDKIEAAGLRRLQVGAKIPVEKFGFQMECVFNDKAL